MRTIPESVTEGASARMRETNEVNRERRTEISVTALALASCIAQESTKSVRMRVKASCCFGRQQLANTKKDCAKIFFGNEDSVTQELLESRCLGVKKTENVTVRVTNFVHVD